MYSTFFVVVSSIIRLGFIISSQIKPLNDEIAVIKILLNISFILFPLLKRIITLKINDEMQILNVIYFNLLF